MTKRTVRLGLIAAILAALPVGLGVSVSGQSEAPPDPMGASRWTGTWTWSFSSGGVDTRGGDYIDQQWTRHGVVAATDPRIAGDWTQNHLTRTYRDASGDVVGIGAATVRIDNADGAWVGTFTGHYALPEEDVDASEGVDATNVLTGEGAYEGLTAVFRYDVDGSLAGVIVPGEALAMPDPVLPPAE